MNTFPRSLKYLAQYLTARALGICVVVVVVVVEVVVVVVVEYTELVMEEGVEEE